MEKREIIVATLDFEGAFLIHPLDVISDSTIHAVGVLNTEASFFFSELIEYDA